MSAYKSFAVVGAGVVGSPIVIALTAANVSVILLSRPGSSKLAPSGVQVVQVDYTDAAAVFAVFKEHKVDVVISTINAEAVGVQKVLADAAQLAAVKLFLPSEFGLPTDGHTGAAVDRKNEITGDIGHLISGSKTYAAPIPFSVLETLGVPTLEIYVSLPTAYT